MKLLYGTASDGVCLRRCFGLDGEVRLPDQVEGIPVTRLGPYLFSDGMERAGILKRMKAPLFLWEEGRGSLPVREPLDGQDLLEWEGLPAASGPALTSLSLPSEIRQVGAYSLYGCSSLKRLEFSLSISDWGAGVFTGCTNLEILGVWPGAGGRSCLKEVLSELRQTLEVEFYDSQPGLARQIHPRACLVLPEFYEESVENTPARIVSRQMHGCGHMYRYCFADGRFSFREYDRLFSYMKAEENPALACRMALYRLYWPEDLGEEAKESYRAYLHEHPFETARNLLRPRCGEILKKVLADPSLSRALWECLSDLAQKEGQRGLTAQLMEAFHQHFGQSAAKGRKRRFEL